MPAKPDMPPLHGLAWIRIDPSSPLGVSLTDEPDDQTARSVHELPDHTLEMHWFVSAPAAQAFVSGVETARRNDVVAQAGKGMACEGVLVAWLSEFPGPAASLEAAIPLVEHDGVSLRRSKVYWRHLAGVAERSGKGRGAAKAININEIAEDRAVITALHWAEMPGNCMFEVRQRPGIYVVRSIGFPYNAGFDGMFGATSDDDLALLARFSARFVDGELEAELPREGFSIALLGLEPLLETLYETFWTRRKAHQIEAMRSDPRSMHIIRAMEEGAVLRYDMRKGAFLEKSDGVETVSVQLVQQLEAARLVRRTAACQSYLQDVDYELGDGRPLRNELAGFKIE